MTTRLFNEEFNKFKHEAIMPVLSQELGQGLIRAGKVVLNVKQYSFDSKTGELIEGVTFVATDGIVFNNLGSANDQGEKGINISNFSISGNEMYRQFEKLPTPPFACVIEYRISKNKTQVVGIYLADDIIEKAKKEKETAKAEKEGGE